jgi:predicted DNA-binding ribbon-helix-helix protein
MKSPVAKRSISLHGSKTSVSLETEFWEGLQEIAAIHGITVNNLIATIDNAREQQNLSSAVRLFVLQHFQDRVQKPDD